MKPRATHRPLRLLYAAGPGNIIGTYKHWDAGKDDPSQVSVTYSRQYYDLCKETGAETYVISRCPQKETFQQGQFRLEHRPSPFQGASGLRFHLGLLLYGLGIVGSALRFRADVAIVNEGTTHWFILHLLSYLGVKVVPSLHTLLWTQHGKLSRFQKWTCRLSRGLFSKRCAAIVAVSDEIGKQVDAVTLGRHRPLLRVFPVYRREEFASIRKPEETRSPFRVLFVGRVENSKGVFDLLDIAIRFTAEGRKNITIDLCGNGSALVALQQAAAKAGVDSIFTCHGHCNKVKMQEMFNRAHVVVVPTRTDFTEGFNKVVVEGILAGRPVITSSVCPDLSYFANAIVEVAPNDTKGYGDAILKLCEDRQLYETKRQGCEALQEKLYDHSRSWGAALRIILTRYI